MKARVIPLFIVLLGSVGGLYGSWTIGDHAATSMAFDLAGKFHGVSGMERASQGLTYITNQSGEWVSVTVDYDPLSRAYTHSLAVDAGGKAHVAYVRGRDVVYATNSTGVWATEVVATPAKYPPFSQSTAIKVTGSSTIEVWFLDPTRIPSWTLQHASKTGSGPWVLVQVGDLIYKLGWADLFLDSANHVHLCYWSGASSEGFTDATLKYGTDVSGTWSDEVIPESITYGGVHDDFTRCSIAQDNRGYLHIGAVVPDALFYATNSTGSWEKKPRIDCLSGKSRTCPNGFYNPSGVAIGVNACDQIYLAYVDSNGLKCDVHANDQWTTSVVDSAGWFDQATILRDPDDHLRFDRYTYWPPPRTITTFAGNGTGGFSGDGGPATDASLFNPEGVAVDAQGNLLIADNQNGVIRRVDHGIIQTIAGMGGQSGYNGDDIAATSAYLNQPTDVATDNSGNLYIADRYNHRIRKVQAITGFISTIAGTGNSGFNGDGPATSAQLNQPTGVAVDSKGDVFIADSANNRVRRIHDGVITTVAGTGATVYNGDGPADTVNLNGPNRVVLDSNDDLLIAELVNRRIRKLHSRQITTVAGNGSMGPGGGDNGPATAASLSFPLGLAVDKDNNILIMDMAYNEGKGGRVRMVDTATPPIITTIAGAGGQGFSGDCGRAYDARFLSPWDVVSSAAVGIFVADAENQRVRKISGAITAPDVTTQQTTGVTENAATLHGQVNPNGAETEYWFEYGAVPTPKQKLLPGSKPQNVSADLKGLKSDTSYSYRLMASNSVGLVGSEFLNFKTPKPTIPAWLSVHGGPASPFGGNWPAGCASVGWWTGFDIEGQWFHVQNWVLTLSGNYAGFRCNFQVGDISFDITRTLVNKRFSMFVTGGPGVYFLNDTNAQLGFNAGLGVSYPINDWMKMQFAYTVNTTVTANPNLQFGRLEGGILFNLGALKLK